MFPEDFGIVQFNFFGTIKGDIVDIKQRLDKIAYRRGN